MTIDIFLTKFIVFVCFKNMYQKVDIIKLLKLEFDIWKFLYVAFHPFCS